MARSVYGDFYSPERVLSYGRPWIFSVGSRSIGKSTGWGIYILRRFLEHGEQFIYVRRTEDELQKTCRGYFGSAVSVLAAYDPEKYGGLSVEYDGGRYYVKRSAEAKREEAGRAVPLSLEHKYKSDDFSRVFWILYDEFMPKTKTGFLGSGTDREREYTAAHSLFVTCDRGVGKPFRNEVHMIFIGNNFTMYNPIYIALGIDAYICGAAKYIAPKGKPWVVEQTGEVEATKAIKESWGYALASDTLRGYNYSNEELTERDTAFVCKIDRPMHGVGNFQFMGRCYGVYYVPALGVLYVRNKPDPAQLTIALTTEDHRVNYYLAATYRAAGVMASLYDAYTRGIARFESGRALYDVINYFKLT